MAFVTSARKEFPEGTPISSDQDAGGEETEPRQTSGPLPDEAAAHLVNLFKLFADETRLRILFCLKGRKELNVQTLCRLVQQTQPAVSHHLALLRMAGVVKMRRAGKHNFYRICGNHEATALLESCFPAG